MQSRALAITSWSTRAKVGWSFGLLVLLAFSLIGWLSGQWVERHLIDLTAKRLNDNASRMATALDVGLFERLREVANLADSASADVPGGGLARADLERLKSTYPYYAWIGVTDSAGGVVAATGGVLEGRNVSERPWWRGAIKRAMVGDIHEALLLQYLLPRTRDDEPLRLIDVSAPVRAGNHLVGVLGAHLSWEWATEVRDRVLEGLDPNDAIQLFVFGPDGKSMPMSPGEAALRPMAADLATLASHGPSDELWSDGGHYLTSAVRRSGYRDYPGMGWTIVVRQPMALAVTPAQRLRNSIWGLGAFGAMLLAGLGWWSSGRLLRPLREVADAAQAESSGPAAAGGDDVRRLSHALGNLVVQLRTRERELLQLTTDLERRVIDRTAELEHRNADLRGMARMVTHDVRAPMGSIVQALRMADSAGPEQQRKWLNLVMRECQHVSEVIDGLLLLSVTESRPLDALKVDMSALATASIDRQRAATGYAGEVEVGPLPVVQGDAVLLGQVWDNLIGNAMKFSRLADAPRIVVSSEHEGKRELFRVEDNGVGFDPSQASRLFTAFERLHRDGRYPGTGLGLSIVQRIVQRHGGDVSAQSSAGSGARFSFTLPTTVD